jgi:glycosyltransferase involved in cell wall biosynthesis
MEGAPLVSVLMTTYNREKYITSAVDSVLASSYPYFELIIVDDGSKDATVGIAEKYAAADTRVRVYTNPKNLGDYPNRNKAASYAKGKYLKYVDADDQIYPWGLELLVRIMEQHPQAGWGLCSLEQDVKRPFPFELTPREAYAYHYQGPGLFHKAPLSAIVRRDVFEKEGGFAPIRMSGDFEMWHRLAQRHQVVLMPHGMVWYREHEEQEMSSYHQYLAEYEKISLRYLTDPACPLGQEEAAAIISGKKKTGMAADSKGSCDAAAGKGQVGLEIFKGLLC